jgi:ATP-binding cassette subfamily F protein uup
MQTKRANAINAAQGKSTAKPFNYEREQLQKQEQATAQVSAAAPTSPVPANTKKLSYKEQRELDELPARIAALEAEQKEANAALADGTLFSKDSARAAALSARSAAIDDEMLAAMERMEALGG